MAKFDPAKWTPAEDSSVGLEHLAEDSVVLTLDKSNAGIGCPCGCGGWPSGPKATFCMGHDARLRGKLIRAHLMGVPIRYSIDGELTEPILAIDVARAHHWASYLAEADMRREASNRELVKKAITSERLLKVFRWGYTGGQVAVVYSTASGDRHLVEYVNRAGDIKSVRVPAEKNPFEGEE